MKKNEKLVLVKARIATSTNGTCGNCDFLAYFNDGPHYKCTLFRRRLRETYRLPDCFDAERRAAIVCR